MSLKEHDVKRGAAAPIRVAGWPKTYYAADSVSRKEAYSELKTRTGTFRLLIAGHPTFPDSATIWCTGLGSGVKLQYGFLSSRGRDGA